MFKLPFDTNKNPESVQLYKFSYIVNKLSENNSILKI